MSTDSIRPTDLTHPIIAALISVIVNYGGTFILVFQGAKVAGLSPEQTASWIWSISIGVGLTGAWLSFRLADEEPICGRICHVAKGTGKLLLANPDWDFAVLLHPVLAESQLRDGLASISSGVSLFNAAAEQALRRTPQAAEVRQS